MPPLKLLHPLMGSNLATLLTVLKRNGGVSRSQWPSVALFLGSALARTPFSAIEHLWVHRALRHLPPMPAPLFIVGHWRSGTTFLYNILSRAPHFNTIKPLATGLPWDFLLLAELFKPLLIKALPDHRFIDRVPVKPDSPQEDEIGLASMQSLSFYHGLYFPQHFTENFNAGIFLDTCSPAQIQQWQRILVYFLQKHYIQHPNQQLLVKNPVYTARIKQLRSIWPNAKFIHIYRNPYIIFHSMRNFYRALFKELALQPYNAVDIDTIILDAYPRILTALQTDSAELPTSDFVELSFEALEQDPLTQLQYIYSTLNLGDYDNARPAFEVYLQSQPPYRKNQYAFAAADIELVRTHWEPLLRGYDPPLEPEPWPEQVSEARHEKNVY